MAKILKGRVARLAVYLVMAFGGVMLLAMVGPASSASAATIPVTTITDEYGTGAGTCSLREAITAANTDAAFGGCVAGSGRDVVNVPAGVYALTRVGSNEDNNATGDLDLRTAMVVSGAGQSLTIVDANRLDRAFHVPVAGVNFELAGLTVQHGLATDAMGGGAYVPEGAAVITGSTFMSNTATQSGGGLFVNRAVTLTNSSFISNTSVISTGGGLYANAQSLIVNTDFLSNTSANIFIFPAPLAVDYLLGGGGMYARNSAVISGTTFESNQGGGLYAFAQVTVINSHFLTNTSISGLFPQRKDQLFPAYSVEGGGGIHSLLGPVVITNSTFRSNQGGGIFTDGGGVFIADSTFASNTTSSSGGGVASLNQRVDLPTPNAGIVVIRNSAFASNSGYGGGGAYASANLTIDNSSFTSNEAQYGGGAISFGSMSISGTLFQSNHAILDAGNGDGGGVYSEHGIVITNSLFISNIADGSGGAINAYSGGLTMVNSLLVGNNAHLGAAISGGGTNSGQRQLALIHVTIASPIVVSGTAIYFSEDICPNCSPQPPVSFISNTIIASYTVGIEAPGGWNTLTEDHNLFYGNGFDRMGVFQGPQSFNGDPAFVNPLAGDYHLRVNSAAIGRGIDAGITPDFDGNPRFPGVNPDIGYVEFSGVLVAGLTASNNSPQLQDAPVQFTASITAGTDVSYQWSFDDGQSGTGITTTHAYEVPGIYTATVIATDRFGGTAIVTMPVTITEPQNPNLAGALDAEFVGRLVTYTFVVSNPNPVQPATNVVVSGSVPPDTQLISTNGISVASGGYYGLGYVTLPTVTLTPTTLAPTQQITLTWTVNVPVLKGSIITRGGAASDNAVIDRRVLVRVVFRKYLPVLSRE